MVKKGEFWVDITQAEALFVHHILGTLTAAAVTGGEGGEEGRERREEEESTGSAAFCRGAEDGVGSRVGKGAEEEKEEEDKDGEERKTEEGQASPLSR